jgi:hypothetical protein
MAIRVTPLTASKLVLVEGKDEERSLTALARELGVADVDIREIGGKSAWPATISTVGSVSGFRDVHSLGLVTDANGNPSGAFASLRDLLSNAGFPRPVSPEVKVPGSPAVTVFVSPGQGRSGELEDIFLQSLNADPAMPCIDDLETCLVAAGNVLPRKRSKMRLQIYIATRTADVYRVLGEACDAHAFDWNDPAFQGIRSFLSGL